MYDQNGNARAFGEFPNYDDNAYFLQVNCEVSNNYPEISSPNMPLEWNADNQAIKVYNIKGTVNGENSLILIPGTQELEVNGKNGMS